MRPFLPYSVGQNLLLPPNVDEWLSPDHPARFVLELVSKNLDLSSVLRHYDSRSGRGAPAYHPMMMMALLIYGYAFGVRSSRKLEDATYDDLAVRYITGNQHPDHDTIAEFRKQHIVRFQDLLVQSLRLCAECGLIKLGDIDLYLDGTKMLANASRHQTVNYAKVRKTEQQLRDIVVLITDEAEALDLAEDLAEKTARETDAEPRLDLKDPQKVREALRKAKERLARVADARAEMERSARAEAEKMVQEAQAKRDEHEQAKKRGRKPVVPEVEELAEKLCNDKQINLTDPDSRIMVDGSTKAFVQAFNCQAVTAGQSQIIVACGVTSEENDIHQLGPMVEMAKANLSQIGNEQTNPYRLGADTGYLSVGGVQDPRLENVDLYLGAGKATNATDAVESADAVPTSGNYHWHRDPAPEPTPAVILREEMRKKISTDSGKDFYNHRSSGIEPVFGETKENRGIRRLLLRGKERVGGEWSLIGFTHNIRKLFRQFKRDKQANTPKPITKVERRKCDSATAKYAQMAFEVA